jgi:hypothetical protein
LWSKKKTTHNKELVEARKRSWSGSRNECNAKEGEERERRWREELW